MKVMWSFPLFVLLMACSGESKISSKEKVTDAIPEMVDDVEKVVATLNRDASIRIAGSETLYPIVSELMSIFTELHPKATASVVGGGSNVGYQKLIDGETNIANSSYMLDSAQVMAMGTPLVPVMIGTDAVAIITHPRVGIESITLQQLEEIYTGKLTNWQELGGSNEEIVLYGRNESSGTYHYVKNKVIGAEYAASLKEMPNYKELIESVNKTRGAIGYASLGYIFSNMEKPSQDVYALGIQVEGDIPHSPYDLESVERGEYALSRPMFQYFTTPPTGQLLEFVKMELSEEGQRIMKEHGYFPLNNIQKMINEGNGLDLNATSEL